MRAIVAERGRGAKDSEGVRGSEGLDETPAGSKESVSETVSRPTWARDRRICVPKALSSTRVRRPLPGGDAIGARYGRRGPMMPRHDDKQQGVARGARTAKGTERIARTATARRRRDNRGAI